jgi:hypothetical protein
MKRIIKTILITSAIIFGTGILFTPLTFIQAQDDLVVEFEKTPLFKEADFKPGDSVTRWVKVTNNSSEAQNIAVEAINYPGFPNPDNVPIGDLSRALSIIIRGKGGSDLYGGSTGEKTLYDFYRKYSFNATYEHVLTYDLPGNGGNITYEFVITFPFEKGNEWQGATTTFDILIGFQGKEGGEPPSPPPGGPGLPPGLTILEETATTTEITTTSVTVIWTTSYFSTSKVIYATSSGLFNLSEGEPKYGYTDFKEGDDSGLEKVTSHSVTITGLTPGTTYYYRAVSHGSLAISQELSFTTLGVKEIGEIEGEIPSEGIPYEEGILPKEVVLAPTGEEVEKPEEFVPEGAVSPEEEIVTVPPSEKVPEEGLASLLLASLGVIGETPWMGVLVVFCLIGLVIIGIREWELARKKKRGRV